MLASEASATTSTCVERRQRSKQFLFSGLLTETSGYKGSDGFWCERHRNGLRQVTYYNFYRDLAMLRKHLKPNHCRPACPHGRWTERTWGTLAEALRACLSLQLQLQTELQMKCSERSTIHDGNHTIFIHFPSFFILRNFLLIHGLAPSLGSSARAKCSQNNHGQVTSAAFRSDNSKQMAFEWRTINNDPPHLRSLWWYVMTSMNLCTSQF